MSDDESVELDECPHCGHTRWGMPLWKCHDPDCQGEEEGVFCSNCWGASGGGITNPQCPKCGSGDNVERYGEISGNLPDNYGDPDDNDESDDDN